MSFALVVFFLSIIIFDVFGNIGNQKEVFDICKKYKINLIIDAAESIGAKRYGYSSGHFSDIVATSFNGNKIITSGMGGAVISKSSEIIEKVRHLSSTANIGKSSYEFIHEEVGFNYRLPALNAALGLSQIKNLDKKIAMRKNVYEFYKKAFSEESIIALHTSAEEHTNHWLNSVSLIEIKSQKAKLRIIKELNKNGIQVRDVWKLHNLNKINQDCYNSDLTNSEIFYLNNINIPSGFNSDEP